MLCYWGEAVTPEGFGLLKTDSVEKLRNGVGFICPKPRIRDVCAGSSQIGFIQGDGQVSVLRPNASAKLKNLDLKKDKIRLISCGEAHTLLLVYGGRVLLMEKSNPCRPVKELSGRNVIQVACGNHHSMALTNDGQLFTWGQNSAGQLGLGKRAPSSPTPQTLSTLSEIPLAQISAGGNHSFALSLSGAVFGWGRNSTGQLGLGHTKDVYTPTGVTELIQKKTVFISCGEEHTATLSKEGNVFTFGSGSYGQLGHNSFTDELRPRLVDELCGSDVSQIACGRHHTLALVESSKKIYSFGCGEQGQLGNGQNTNQCVPVPVSLPSEAKDGRIVQNLTAGGNHSFLLCSPPESGNKTETSRLKGIMTLGDRMIQRWISESDSKQWQEIKKEIKSVFSSAACLNGSFIDRSGDAHYQTSTDVSGLDLESARAAFEQLAKKEKVLLEVEKVVEKDLLPSLGSRVAVVEALRVYLILPELCRVLTRDQTIKLALAEAILKLDPRFLTVLGTYWFRLPDPFFRTVVKLFHNWTAKLLCRILDDYGQKTFLGTDLQISVNMLQILYRDSCKSQREIAATDFIVHEINDLFDTLQTIQQDLYNIYWGHKRISDEFQLQTNKQVLLNIINLLISAPCVFNLEAKSNLIKFRTVFAPFRLVLRRTALIEDCFRQLRHADQLSMKGWLEVVYCEDFKETMVNMKDFFHEAVKELLDPESKMFMYDDTKSLIWFPTEPSLPDERYYLLGLLCGLAFYNNCVVHMPFPSALFKKLLDVRPSIKDLAELSPSIAQSLQYVLDYPDDDAENMHMYYTIEWNSKEVELDPNEPGKAVTSSNKAQFVEAYLDYVLNKSVERVFEQFKLGFFRVCDRHMVALFTPEELRGVMVGSEQYDWDTLRKNTRYEGEFYSNHSTILTFWEVFDELSECEKKSFLLFLTGFDRVPILGMKHVRMRIRPLFRSTEDHLPQALTCHSILELPVYHTKEKLQEKLIEALQHKRGFWEQ